MNRYIDIDCECEIEETGFGDLMIVHCRQHELGFAMIEQVKEALIDKTNDTDGTDGSATND